MIRVLHIFHEMANGGVEAFVMNNYNHIDRSKVQFDFLTTVDQPGYYDEEILKLGGKLYRTYPLLKNLIKCYKDIARIVKENNYQIVHRHAGSGFGYFDLRAAKSGGAKYLIMHSHNPQARIPILHKPSKLLLTIESEKLACSKEAGIHLFGKNSDFLIFPNGIDCDKYKYNEITRNEVRKELNIGDNTFVIGHIGRFEEQKNHIKLLQIFAEFHKILNDSLLICVGSGSLLNQIRDYAKQLKIDKYILFLGNRNDVPRIIQSFDSFCFPSLYEGFSLTQIEAQVNGLQCFVSKDSIANETDLTGNVCFIPLEANAKEWAEFMIKNRTYRDLYAIDKVVEAGYDIKKTSKRLLDLYMSFENKEI